MKESEYDRRFNDALAAEVRHSASAANMAALARRLAKEAGAVFEPEGMKKLPELVIVWPNRRVEEPMLMMPLPRDTNARRTLSEEQLAEIIRRCKAIESAVEYCREMAKRGNLPALPMTYGEISAHLLSILEGRP